MEHHLEKHLAAARIRFRASESIYGSKEALKPEPGGGTASVELVSVCSIVWFVEGEYVSSMSTLIPAL